MQDGDLIQVAYLVKDLMAATRFYHETTEIGPWEMYTFSPPALRELMVRGKPSDHTFRIALATAGPVQIELIQPLTGHSIYDEFLEHKGEGLHHVKYYYRDCQKALESYQKKGITVIQSGRYEDDEHYYMDTEQHHGMIIELGNNGKIGPPELVYPS